MIASSEPSSVVRFGVFEADLRAGELRKNGFKIKIQDLPFRALKLLLSRPNEVVTREEFRDALWPQDVFVDFERAISSAVKRLRDAIGDSADNPLFIETIDRRGYRWIAPVSVAPGSGPLPVIDAAPAQEVHKSDSAATAVSGTYPLADHNPLAIWKLTYVLPVLGLLFVAWSLRSGFHLPRAVGGSQAADTSLGATRHPANHEAEQMYLQGRYYWNKRTPEDLQKAVDYFTQAIVHDPGYSDAYVGLADCYNLLREYTAMPSTEAYPRALAAARKAVELDDQSSQAHASLAFASNYGAWDAATADREFRRAIELDPSNATAHHWYAGFLASRNRLPEALAEIGRAQALDPSSKSILADKGTIMFTAGQRQEAIALLQQIEKAEPEFMSPHRYLKSIHLAMGDYLGYLAEMKQEATLTQNKSALIVAAAAEKGYNRGGPTAMFEGIRREQQKLYDAGQFSPFTLAESYAMEGNKEAAVKYLQAAIDQHEEGITQLEVDRAFDHIREEPSFQQIRAEMALHDSQMAKKGNSPR